MEKLILIGQITQINFGENLNGTKYGKFTLKRYVGDKIFYRSCITNIPSIIDSMNKMTNGLWVYVEATPTISTYQDKNTREIKPCLNASVTRINVIDYVEEKKENIQQELKTNNKNDSWEIDL